jgi:hypothetical protein
MVVLARHDRGAAALSAAQIERVAGVSKYDDNLDGDSARSATASTVPG